MEADIDPKTYELAYHLNPDLEEAGVKAHMEEIGSMLIHDGGSIINSREPKKIHLSYPIKNKNYAYFGLIDFTALPETIEKLNSQMKLQNNILRFLLTGRSKKELRILGQYKALPRAIKTHKTPTVTEIPVKEKTKEETEQLEKDIEKVIEGL